MASDDQLGPFLVPCLIAVIVLPFVVVHSPAWDGSWLGTPAYYPPTACIL